MSSTCTTLILAYNSAATVRKALESVQGLGPVVLCDGGSQDGTLSIAREFGARVIEQEQAFKNADGTLRDYSGVRNQLLDASEGWVLFLDSDEYASPELVGEIRKRTAEPPGAFWVPRRYTLRGVEIDCASTYPNQQMRFFHKDAVERYIKEVHERIVVREGAPVGALRCAIMTPLPESPEALKSKWRRYLSIEASRRPPTTLRAWARGAMHELAVAVLLAARMARAPLCRGTRLPFAYERARLWYQWRLIADSWRTVCRF